MKRLTARERAKQLCSYNPNDIHHDAEDCIESAIAAAEKDAVIEAEKMIAILETELARYKMSELPSVVAPGNSAQPT